MLWTLAVDILILLAVLADIAVWYFDRKKQSEREQKLVELQERVVKLLEEQKTIQEESQAELVDIRDELVEETIEQQS